MMLAPCAKEPHLQLLDDIQVLEARRDHLVDQAEQAYLEFNKIERDLDRLRAALDPTASSKAPAADRSLTNVPTQEGPLGLRYDFNCGARIMLPPACDHSGPWRIRLTDLDTELVLFETEVPSGCAGSIKKYFIRFRIDIWQNGQPLFSHDYDAAGRDVLIRWIGR
jgi:hypothetical protein